MARRARVLLPQRHARLEIIPMIDIMMFLLVFFVMITLSMIPNAGLPIDLPGVAHTAALDSSPVTIGVDRDGHAHIDGEDVPFERLKARLQATDGRPRSVVIAADRTVGFQHVMTVMDLVRSAGIRQIGLATRTE